MEIKEHLQGFEELKIAGKTITIREKERSSAKELSARLRATTLDRENVRSYLEGFIAFLAKPILTDEFENHEERRTWRHTLSPQDRERIDANRLRKNEMASVLQPFEFFLLLYTVPEGRSPEHLRQLSAAANTLKTELESYDNLELEQKIAFAKKVSDFLEQATLALIKLYEVPAR